MFGGHDDAHMGDSDSAGGHDGHHDWAGRLPFLSMRFWTWGVTFFGLTGLVLTLAGTASALVPVLAAIGGVGSGWGASYVIGRLTRETVGLLPEANTHLGREGTLLLPLQRGGRSKIRLSIGGVETDLLAETDIDGEIPAESKVFVVGLRGMTAVVEPMPTALSDGSDEKQDSGKEES
jgi:membrane protein implicated in regulation of membrane protease activity